MSAVACAGNGGSPRRGRSLLSALPLLAALAACSPPPPAVDVVLVTIDTLRADHVGAYGAKGVATPTLDALAAESLLFERAVAPLPETKPSHLTIFSSLYPADHGVVSNGVAFPSGLATLPRLFGAAGAATGGFAACALFDAAGGEALGFDHFDAPAMPQRTADEVVPPAIAWLKSVPRERRVFLWLHLFDPHMPYRPPPPWNASRPGGAPPELAASLPAFAWPRLLEVAGRHGGDLPAPILARARELYAGEVEYADHWLGRFFDGLRQADRWRETVVLVTADHGECFENGVYFDHSQCLGEGALAVPLLLRAPGRVTPGRARAVVEHLDVAPTLLHLAGLAVPASFAGRDLRQLAGAPADESLAFFQHPVYLPRDVANRQDVLDELRSVAGDPTRPIVGDRVQVGARRGDLKYLLRGADEELYDLAADPGERRDLAAAEPERRRQLQHAVRSWMKAHPFHAEDLGEIDPELRRQLEALGYL